MLKTKLAHTLAEPGHTVAVMTFDGVQPIWNMYRVIGVFLLIYNNLQKIYINKTILMRNAGILKRHTIDRSLRGVSV